MNDGIMKMTRIAALAAALFVAAAPAALAQTVNDPPGAATTARVDDDRGIDWGWIGLIGLAGLAGLARRDRTPHATSSTYQAARSS